MTKRETHRGLIKIVQGIAITQGLPVVINKEYKFGELDVLLNNIYYECKSTFSPRNIAKGSAQIARAIQKGQCTYGFLLTPEGVYDVFKDKLIGGK